MFSLKGKLSDNLRHCLNDNTYKSYRLIIHYRKLKENTEGKITGLKGNIIHSIPKLNLISAILEPWSINRLIENPDVDYIDFDRYAYLCGNGVLSSNFIFHSERYSLTGEGISVGLVDSGTYPHPDLLKPSNKIKYFRDYVNSYKYPYDDNGHGTFMTGIICGNGYLSDGMYKGIAPRSNICSIKAFNSLGRGYVSNVLYSIEELIEISDEYKIKVICLPFELVDFDAFTLELFSDIFNLAVNKGITVVVPSGSNENFKDSIRGIGLSKNCITVSGVDTTCSVKPYRYSSSGPCGKLNKPDISAACVSLCSLNTEINYISERNGSKVYPSSLKEPYTCYTGTSCSAAFISGVCALLYQNNPSLTFKDVLSLLKVSSTLQKFNKSYQGNGILEFSKLLP